jgi:hypothetical protein
MFTKDYTLLVGLKYCIKLSTKLLSKEMLSTYIDLRGTLDPREPLGPQGLVSHVTFPRPHLEFSMQAAAYQALGSKFARNHSDRNTIPLLASVVPTLNTGDKMFLT